MQGASPLHDLTAFQRDLLASLTSLDAPTGMDVNRALEADYETELTDGGLYPALDNLVEKGLITKIAVNARRNEYELTERGRRKLVSHNDWQSAAIQGGQA
jgi:DNA-binding PadR family transcriptional regulator